MIFKSLDPEANSVRFPHSHGIPASTPSGFPCIDVNGRAHGHDKMALAIQTTPVSKVRRVDFGDCGPPQPTSTKGVSDQFANPFVFYAPTAPTGRPPDAYRREPPRQLDGLLAEELLELLRFGLVKLGHCKTRISRLAYSAGPPSLIAFARGRACRSR